MKGFKRKYFAATQTGEETIKLYDPSWDVGGQLWIDRLSTLKSFHVWLGEVIKKMEKEKR